MGTDCRFLLTLCVSNIIISLPGVSVFLRFKFFILGLVDKRISTMFERSFYRCQLLKNTNIKKDLFTSTIERRKRRQRKRERETAHTRICIYIYTHMYRYICEYVYILIKTKVFLET